MNTMLIYNYIHLVVKLRYKAENMALIGPVVMMIICRVSCHSKKVKMAKTSRRL